MYEGPISADFRGLALHAVEKSNDAEAVNKGLDDLVKYSNTADENSQALAREAIFRLPFPTGMNLRSRLKNRENST